MTYPPAILSLSTEATQILAECRQRYLQQLGQLLEAAEPVSAKAVANFQQTVGNYFDEMTQPQRRSGFQDSDGLTASRIGLIGDNDLELDIRLAEFSARLAERTGGDLWRVYLRFVTLLRRPDLNVADNPLGPRGIARGLTDFCSRLGESHEKTLARITRLEIYFAEHLGALYAGLNDYLAKQHVEAAQPSIVSAPEANAPKASSKANPNAAAALQKQLLGPAGQGLLAGPAANLLSQAIFERLLARLDDLEQQALTNPGSSGNAATANHLANLAVAGDTSADAPQALDSQRLGVPNSAPEAATIDALARIFEVIFESKSLPESIKSALASLQIPTLKAAMLDPSFFTTDAHPARQLLDKIAGAAIGLPADAGPQHPLCRQISTLASHVRAEFSGDNKVFERYLLELNNLAGNRDKAAIALAEACMPLLQQVDQQKRAAQQIRPLIERHIATGVPASIARFLRNDWRRVLAADWQDGGDQNSNWPDDNAVIEALLWCIQPKTEADDRKRVAKLLPAVLQRINAGLTRIGVSQEAQAEFLDICFSLQAAAMHGTAPEIQEPGAATATSAPPFSSELRYGSQTLRILDRLDQNALSSHLRPPPVPLGRWLVFPFRDATLCGRLSLISPDSGMLLLANPDWGYCVALNPDLLADLLKAGTARVWANESLFNAAAEQALSRNTGH